jgi:hypothetical protein
MGHKKREDNIGERERQRRELARKKAIEEEVEKVTYHFTRRAS